MSNDSWTNNIIFCVTAQYYLILWYPSIGSEKLIYNDNINNKYDGDEKFILR